MDFRKAPNSPCNPITPCAQSPVFSNENRRNEPVDSRSPEQRPARQSGAVTPDRV